MTERKRGSIINISSVGGLRGHPEIAHYCASKAGVNSLSESLAREVGEHGVRVNAVCPGWVDASMGDAVLDWYAQSWNIPAKSSSSASAPIPPSSASPSPPTSPTWSSSSPPTSPGSSPAKPWRSPAGSPTNAPATLPAPNPNRTAPHRNPAAFVVCWIGRGKPNRVGLDRGRPRGRHRE